VYPCFRWCGLKVLSLVSVVCFVLVCVTSSQAATLPAVSCSLYASPSGSGVGDGSQGEPFGSAQRLVSALAPGQTGCLMGGVYSQPELSFARGGQAGAPITLASFPGQTATLTGGFVYVPSGSNDVTIENVHIDTAASTQVGVQLMATDGSLIGDDITNDQAHTSCIILGSNLGWGQALGTVIEDDVIHQCGNVADGNQDHAIYFDNTIDAQVSDNVIWGTAAFAIHLYQDAQGTRITHNVIVDNGYGVIFAGSAEHASDNNIVAHNIIADSTVGYDVQSWWGGTIGTGNIAQDNCLADGRMGDQTTVSTGFSSSNNLDAASPMFVDAAAHDYQLQSGSPCQSIIGSDTAAGIAATPVATAARAHNLRAHSTRKPRHHRRHHRRHHHRQTAKV